MNYIIRQKNAKLDNWYIARKLGLKLNEWVDVRMKRRALADKKLDVFNELTYANSNEWVNQESEKEKINEWFDSKSTKDLQEMIDNFNLTQKAIADDIGVDVSNVCKTVNKKAVNGNVKSMLYYYLNDENNKKYVKKKKVGRPKFISKKVNEEEVVETKEEQLPQKEENGAIETTNETINKEAIWYNQFQMMANKYHDTNNELKRYKFLIDEIIRKEKTIQELKDNYE